MSVRLRGEHIKNSLLAVKVGQVEVENQETVKVLPSLKCRDFQAETSVWVAGLRTVCGTELNWWE